jgi:hypothetical protein
MPSAAESILADIIRLGNSPINEGTIPGLRDLCTKILEFADSLVPKGGSVDECSDFEDALDELTGITDNLEAACDVYDLAEEEDSRDEAFETAGEVLVDLAIALQEVDQLAVYIETTEQLVASKWGSELARIIDLPSAELRAALDALLDQTRTPKESALLLILANEAILERGR